jgi:hypothetical protein
VDIHLFISRVRQVRPFVLSRNWLYAKGILERWFGTPLFC